jgi:hypothetical protein
VHVAVVAAERLRQGADAGDVVPADVAQQLHALAGHDAGEGVPALERKVALVEGLAAFGAVLSIDEPTRRLVPHRAADGDFHVAHLPPRKVRTSDQKSAIRPLGSKAIGPVSPYWSKSAI